MSEDLQCRNVGHLQVWNELRTDSSRNVNHIYIIIPCLLYSVALAVYSAQNSMHHLCRFIRNAFAMNYSSRNTEKTKTLDKLTKDIEVPSRNGRNFASNLPL